jgi:hydrogenase maturation protein HypF
MLPYTPIHHLLVADYARHLAGDGRLAALVMTSGNVSDEPIAYQDADAIERLARIADVFLLHDRQIHARTDDSVARLVTIAGRPRAALIRRARGYVPRHLELPVAAARPILACGAQQKNTFCLARGRRAWVSHHIGDLEHFDAYESFRTGVEHFQELFAARPALVAHDLHPSYLSTQYALEREGVEILGVQHHHAHLASCLAEHGVEGPAVGAIFDGTGYGTDGAVWGGELLVGDLRGFERAGSLRQVPLPGAAAAIREPWRMAFAWLRDSADRIPAVPSTLAGSVDERRWLAIARVADDERLSPQTTSMGRLFDAVAALCGLAPHATYEGQAAVELEAAAGRSTDRGSYELQLVADNLAGLTLDPRAMLLEASRDLEAGLPIPTVASRFHAAVAEATVRACLAIAGPRRLDTAVLSGGVFQNRLLITAVAAGLDRAGLRVLSPQALPANDGGISFGQAAIAAACMTGGCP